MFDKTNSRPKCEHCYEISNYFSTFKSQCLGIVISNSYTLRPACPRACSLSSVLFVVIDGVTWGRCLSIFGGFNSLHRLMEFQQGTRVLEASVVCMTSVEWELHDVIICTYVQFSLFYRHWWCVSSWVHSNQWCLKCRHYLFLTFSRQGESGTAVTLISWASV